MSSSERPETLRIKLFGPELQITLAGVPLGGSAPPKTRGLLAYLILNAPDFISREAAASALWPDCSDAEARKNLRRHLSLLGHYLPEFDGVECLERDGKFLRWNRTCPATVDVLEFDAHGPSPATRAYAVEQYAGELLSAYDEEWLEPIRERYRARAAEWLAALVDAHEPFDAAACLRYARALLEVDPLREDVLHRMMKLRLAGGDRAGALREFAEFRDRLERDLGVAPSSETLALADRIRGELDDGASAIESKQRSAHPLETTFVGRERACQELERLILSNGLVTVIGIGGLGKSRLAREVSARLAERHGLEICTIRMLVGAAAGPVEVEIGNALGLAVEQQSEIVHLIAEYARQRRLLVVLDACEQRIESVRAAVDRLHTACPAMRFLATSREPLKAAEEVLYRLGPLEVPILGAEAASNIVSSEAGALFLERSHALAANGVLSESDREALVEICRRLGGIPLALELAAARRRLLTIPQIAERLNDPALVMDALPGTDDQERTVAAAIAWSYQALTSAEQSALRRLCVFESSFSIDAAEHVIGAAGGGSSVIDILSALIDRSLVLIASGPDETRYLILDPIREFGARALVDLGEAARGYEAAVAYFVDLCGRLGLPEGEPAPRTAFERIERDRINIRGAILGFARASLVGQLAAGSLERAATLLERVSLVWQLRGHITDGRACATALLASSTGWNPSHGTLLLEAATFARLEGDYAAARAYALECARCARSAGNVALEADASFADGIIAYTSADVLTAEERLAQARRLYAGLDDDAHAGRCAANIANLQLGRRDYETAAATMRDAIVALRSGGHRRWLAAALGAMGYVERYRGNLDEAARYSREALASGTRTGDRQLTGSALANLAFVHVSRNDVRNAAAYIRAGLELLSDGAFPFVILSLLESLARLCIQQERFDDAASALAALTAIIERYSITRSDDDRALVAKMEEAVNERIPELELLRRREQFIEGTLSSCVSAMSARVSKPGN